MEINEKKLKEILREQREKYQRHLDVVVEDFKSQIQLISETLSGQQEQLTAIREITKQNVEAIADLQTQVLAIREMVAKNTEDIEIMKTEMIAIKKDMIAMKRDIEIMKADISTIKYELKRKVSWDEFEALEKRVLILEKKPKST